MNEEITELALQLRTLIGKSREITDQTSFNEAFIMAEQILGTLAYLISPIMLLEQRYRQKVAMYLESGDTASKAEIKAKALDEYMEWRKYSQLYDLGHEAILLLKKFKNKLDDEYTRS